MDYQVWIKDEFGDSYTKVDCGDLAAAKREIDVAYQKGKAPLLTIEVPYELSINVSEVGSEAAKSKAKPDKGSGVESKGAVRSGDLGAIPELDKGSGDTIPGDSVPSK